MAHRFRNRFGWVRADVAGWCLVLLLTAANVLAYADRQLLALLFEPVRLDLKQSDTAMGVLYGTSFSVVYALAGVPITLLAHRWHRPRIIGTAIACWSTLTALSGLAGGFLSLMLLRFGVGMSEAGLAPTAMSLIAERFSGRRLTLALGIFVSANYLGNGAAMCVGGLLSRHLDAFPTLLMPMLGSLPGWRLIFLIVGTPGLALAAVFWLLPERENRVTRRDGYSAAASQHFRAERGVYISAVLAFGLMVLAGSQANAWIPTLLARQYHWSLWQIGWRYGLVTLLAGTLGAIVAGYLANIIRRHDRGITNIWLPLSCLTALVPLTIAFPLAPSGDMLLLIDAIMLFVAAASQTFGYTILAEITPPGMRGTATAGFALVLNLIGPGIGPSLGPAVSDHLLRGGQDLPVALALVGGVASMLSVASFLHLTARLRRSSDGVYPVSTLSR